MSEPRHAMIYRDAMHQKWWLEIVAYDIESDCDTPSGQRRFIRPI